MPLTRRSKIKEALRHPVGHDLLHNLAHQLGRSEQWLENPLVGNLMLQQLDRFGGTGFCDMLLEAAAAELALLDVAAIEKQLWWKEAVVYRLFVPSFMDADHDGMGDIAGVMQRLPYLEQLGVNVLWLGDVMQPPQGTGVCDYYAVSEEYGTVKDVEQLVQKAHELEMRVVMGMDITATSKEHAWFKQAMQGEANGFYCLKAGQPNMLPNGWTQPEGGPAWRWYDEAGCWGLQLSGPNKVELNWDNPAVRAEMANVLRFWQGKGVDGFIFDQVGWLSKSGLDDTSPQGVMSGGANGYERDMYSPRLHRYLRELRAELRPTFLAGGVRAVGTEMAKLFTTDERGELDLVFDESHLVPRQKPKKKLFEKVGAEEPHLELTDIKQYYIKWMSQYAKTNWMSLFWEGAGQPRIVSRMGASPLYRAILAKMLATMQFTLHGTPVIYQGGELGLSNTRFASPLELRSHSALKQYAELSEYMGDAAAMQHVLAAAPDHAWLPMPWSGGVKAGFTGAEPWIRMPERTEYLNVVAQKEDEGSVLQHYSKLIALRKQTQSLVYGSFNPVFVKNPKVFCYFRILDKEKWYVEINLTEKVISRPGRISHSQKLTISNYDTQHRMLRPYEANLYRCE